MRTMFRNGRGGHFDLFGGLPTWVIAVGWFLLWPVSLSERLGLRFLDAWWFVPVIAWWAILIVGFVFAAGAVWDKLTKKESR